MQQVYVFLQRWHLEVAAVLGFLLDRLLGDPESWYHPVRAIGSLVRELERRLYPKAGPPVAAFWNGLFLWPRYLEPLPSLGNLCPPWFRHCPLIK